MVEIIIQFPGGETPPRPFSLAPSAQEGQQKGPIRGIGSFFRYSDASVCEDAMGRAAGFLHRKAAAENENPDGPEPPLQRAAICAKIPDDGHSGGGLPQHRDIGAALRREVLNAEWFVKIRQAQAAINQWLRQYKHLRPNQALNMRAPLPKTI